MGLSVPVALFALQCFFLTITNLLAAEDVMELGYTLTPESPPLRSAPDGSFLLSFRPSSSSSSSSSSNPNSKSSNSFLYLAISFSPTPNDHPAWVANRHTPVSASAFLNFSSSGDLLLLYDPVASSPIIWSSPTSGFGVLRAQLLDTGNLVLINSSAAYVWQSFQYPFDTLLPNQPFTPYVFPLISSRRSDDYSRGFYSLIFDLPTGSMKLIYTQYSADTSYPQDYWQGGSFSPQGVAAQTISLQFDQFGKIFLYNSPSSISLTLVSTDYGTIATRRITLDTDGNLRMYTWNQASAQWISVWLLFEDVCSRVRQLCGNYGVCIQDPQPTCICPPGFSTVDSADLSGGCSPDYTIDHGCDNAKVKFVELEGVDYPFNDYYDHSPTSLAWCEQECAARCDCLAAVYWQSDGHCWLKRQVQNGYATGTQKHRTLLKISNSNPYVPSPIVDSATQWSSHTLWRASSTTTIAMKKSTRLVIIILAVVVTVQFLLFVLTIAVWIHKARKELRYMKLHEDLETVSGSPILYNYQELEVATQNFSHKLGAGGFGTVYKGQLQDGRVVAVKQLEGVSQQEEKQFRAEIGTIGKIHHVNLVRLLGFCADSNHRMLVYEYMENGSLDQMLFEPASGASVLDWDTRFQICLGVARGITYLHEECLDCILHCDIKPQNILLNRNYCAKVADFGLAYLFSPDHTVKMTTIRGTRGYLAPEWVSNLPITAKADVYSYGMLIMEIVSGRKNYLYTESAMMETNEKWCFPKWAYDRRVEEVVDARMEEKSINWKQAEDVLKVGFACIQADMTARPPMGKVVQMLEGTLPIHQAPPPCLFFDAAILSSSSAASGALNASSSAPASAALTGAPSSPRFSAANEYLHHRQAFNLSSSKSAHLIASSALSSSTLINPFAFHRP